MSSPSTRRQQAGKPGSPSIDGELRPDPPRIEDFLGDPTRRLEDWAWLWRENRSFPIRSHRRFSGKVVVLFKRLLRPLVVALQGDLLDRQRVFNLILLDHQDSLMAELRSSQTALVQLQTGFAELRSSQIAAENVLTELQIRMARVEALMDRGLGELSRHTDALYGRVDRKLDRYRRETRELRSHLGAALGRIEATGGSAGGEVAGAPDPIATLARAREEIEYLAFEARHRGTEEEIASRVRGYLSLLEGRSPILDLGSGRGEALAVFSEAGIEARGVDTNAEMVTLCKRQGLEVVEGDLLVELAAQQPGSLGAVVSFHVIEHLPTELVGRLLRLAWGALRPGGVLLLETPNPLSLVVAARNFWLDPTHQRPVHPDYLIASAVDAGFEPVERLDLRPFEAEDRLPEVPLDWQSPEAARLADAVNRLRDRLDELLFGFQDYAIVAEKPRSSI